jgi:hypothetical protein
MGATTKRMSADEKRKVVLGIYHETKAVYTEKEVSEGSKCKRALPWKE